MRPCPPVASTTVFPPTVLRPPFIRSHADDTLTAAVVLDELPGEVLLVDGDVALDELLVEHLDQHVPRDVGRVDRPRRAGGAERALSELAVLAAREERPPVLELVDVAGRLAREDLDRVLVAQVVGALDGVEGMDLRRVLRGVPERGVDPALRRAGMAAGRMELRDHTDVGTGVVGLDGCAHACAACADDQDVVGCFHVKRRYRRTLNSRARSDGAAGLDRADRSRSRSARAHARSRIRRVA